MKDDGSGYMILGAGLHSSETGKGAQRIFENYLYSHYNVVDNFEVSGDLYAIRERLSPSACWSSMAGAQPRYRWASTARNKLTGSRHGTTFGTELKGYEMKLNNGEKAWAPQDQPQYLSLLKSSQNPPKSAEVLLQLQVKLLSRLVSEASPEEVKEANRRLELNLQQEELLNLPPGLLQNPRCPSLLLNQPAALNYKLAEWKQGMKQAVTQPPMEETEARSEAEAESLESFLGRIL